MRVDGFPLVFVVGFVPLVLRIGGLHRRFSDYSVLVVSGRAGIVGGHLCFLVRFLFGWCAILCLLVKDVTRGKIRFLLCRQL